MGEVCPWHPGGRGPRGRKLADSSVLFSTPGATVCTQPSCSVPGGVVWTQTKTRTMRSTAPVPTAAPTSAGYSPHGQLLRLCFSHS